MLNHTRMMQIHPPDDWLKTGQTRDSQARTRLVDSSSVLYHVLARKHNAFSVLHYVIKVTLPYYITPIRDFFRPWNYSARLYKVARLLVGN